MILLQSLAVAALDTFQRGFCPKFVFYHQEEGLEDMNNKKYKVCLKY